ncbi:MAG: hypothetical protein EBS70_00580 [Actinobacteria bacterium]|nr:hypothetical protein [Actinomycetota bacterium]
MRELDAHRRSVRTTELNDRRPRGDVVVPPHASIVERVASDWGDCRRLSEDESVSTGGERTQPLHVPGIHDAIVCRVLAHRRDPEAVLDSDVANGQWTEEK